LKSIIVVELAFTPKTTSTSRIFNHGYYKVLFDKVVYAVKSGDKAPYDRTSSSNCRQSTPAWHEIHGRDGGNDPGGIRRRRHIEDRMRSPIFHLKRPTASAEIFA
jgi:hypothetical protein